MHSRITILGGGLTGLTLAYLLHKEQLDYKIIEARPRLGGRIFTKMSGNHIPIDLGAAWLWENNQALKGLIKELQIKTFVQRMGDKAWYQPQAGKDFVQISIPSTQQISYRLHGGSTNLILSLSSTLDQQKIVTGTAVKSIELDKNLYTINTTAGVHTTDIVICTLPPALASQLNWSPGLPDNYIATAQQTHTWMQDSIKFGLGFSKQFWKEKQIPMTAFSSFSIVSEMYDYTSENEDRFAIMGFLNAQFATGSPQQRQESVLDQLEKIMGPEVRTHVSYEDCDWSSEPFTKLIASQPCYPHQNNGNPVLRSSFNNNTLHMAGSETSAIYPGYMEGAVNSAFYTYKKLLQ